MAKKQVYQLRNWTQYNKSLVNRGSLIFWFEEKTIKKWHDCKSTKEPGRPQLYSDLAIRSALIIRAVFHLSLRATEGFIASLITLMRLKIKCPNYTTLCKRQRSLENVLPRKLLDNNEKSMHIVVDSTGLKIFGEGEWKVRQYDYRKRTLGENYI